MNWFEIFKTGTHTDSEGRTREWTEADLEFIASSYKPETHEAPIVIGHPKEDSPAYGWVEALKREGERLLAKPKDLSEEFLKKFRKGEYKKVSIAVYPDLTLRHIGFLGAVPPAVKGLKQATFSEKPAWVIESEFFMEPWQQETIKSIFQRMRDWMIDKFSLEEADKVIGSYDLDALKPEPVKEVAPIQNGASAFNANSGKGGKHMDVAKLISDLKAFITGAEKELAPLDNGGAKFTEAEVQAREAKAKKDAETIAFAEVEKMKKEKDEAVAKIKAIEDQKQKDENASFCEALCKEGKLTPALRKIIEPIMNYVGALPTGYESPMIEFAEGVKKPALEGIKDFLTEIPKVVTFKEVTPKEGPGTGGSSDEKFSALIKQKMEAKKDLSYAAAFSEVQKENPELAKELLAEIRPQKNQ